MDIENDIDNASDIVAKQLGLDIADSSDTKTLETPDGDGITGEPEVDGASVTKSKTEKASKTGSEDDDSSESDGEEDESEEDESEEDESDTEGGEKLAKPDSWAKDKQAVWDGLTKDAQEYINKRETDFKEGIKGYKLGHDYGFAVNDVINQHRETLPEGVDDISVVNNLLAHHRALVTGDDESRRLAYIEIGLECGILTEDDLGDQDVLAKLEKRRTDGKIASLEHQNANSAADAEYAQRYQEAQAIVDQFAADHEFFYELEPIIADLIRKDYTLEQAYTIAVRSNDDIWAKFQQSERKRLEKEANDKKAAQLAKAQKANSVNMPRSNGVKSGKTDSSAKTEETMEDTMRATLAAYHKRTQK